MSEYQVDIHEPCQLHHTALLGHGTVIWPFSTILEGAVLGKGCLVSTGVFIGRRARIGDGTRLQNNAAIPDEAIIGQYCYIGPNVVCASVNAPMLRDKAQEVAVPPMLEDDVIVGANAVLLPGVVIGRGAVIGAGAVVTHDVPAGVTVVGNPARRLYRTAGITPSQAELRGMRYG